MKFVIERWTGRAWNASLCSPYKTMAEVTKHLKEYSWHYTAENPYRIVNFKPKKRIQKYIPKYNFQDWNSDRGLVITYK